MSKSNKCRRQIEIVGLIPSIPYQRAIKCATQICRYYPRYFAKPKIRGMLEFDWDEHLTKQKRKFGGQLWALLRPVAVYVDNEFIGCDEDLVEMVNQKFVYSLPSGNGFFEKAMLDDYTRYLEKTERLHVYLEINIDEKHIGHLIFQLYSDLLPATSYNFRCLCTGEEKKELRYKGTRIHRIANMGWIQGGDNENITGGGGRSIYGATFPDESYCISHDRRGVLCMANDGKHSNGSQFFVTLQPTLWMDYYYVAFGQLVEGVEVLKAIESVEERYEEPKKCIKISDCGIVYEPTSKEYRKRMQPYQSEEMRRKKQEELESRMRKKEEMEKAEATLLEEARLAEEVLDVRDLDSYMYVDRYLAGFYYLFNAPPRKEREKEEVGEEVEIVTSITDELLDNVVNHIGRYIVDEILSKLEERSMSLEDDNETMVHKIVSDIVTRATIHLEVEAATEFVDEIVAKAVETVHQILREQSGEEIDVPLAVGTKTTRALSGDEDETDTEVRVDNLLADREAAEEGGDNVTEQQEGTDIKNTEVEEVSNLEENTEEKDQVENVGDTENYTTEENQVVAKYEEKKEEQVENVGDAATDNVQDESIIEE